MRVSLRQRLHFLLRPLGAFGLLCLIRGPSLGFAAELGRQADDAFAGRMGQAALPSEMSGAAPAWEMPEHWRRCDPVLRQELVRWHSRGDRDHLTRSGPAVIDPGGVLRFPCWVLFEEMSALSSDPRLKSHAPGRARARLTPSELEELLQDSEVLSIQAAARCQPLLDVSLVEIQADQVHSGIGDPPVYSGLTGTGVVVGIVDTGVDWSHQDFKNGADTRLASLWDQTVPAQSPPGGYSYGREWTSAEIDGGSCTETDAAGHGSHVLGTMAGNGSASGNEEPDYQFVGLAPSAPIVAVKTDFFSTSIIDAVEYIFDQAATLGMPAVVNLSLGHHYGPHDGTEETDLALSALAGPGRVVVAAAGNEQTSKIHAEGIALVGDSVVVTVTVSAFSAAPGAANDLLRIDGYFDAGAVCEILVRSPAGHVVGPLGGGSVLDVNTPEGGVYLENDYFDPTTPDHNVFIQIYDKLAAQPPASGTWTIVLRPTSALLAGGVEVDYWLYDTTLSPAPVFTLGESAEELVASPASGDSVIAVAAYVTKKTWTSQDGFTYGYSPAPTVGAIASFSNHGPRRDGVLKPDISGPGMGIGAALSVDSSVDEPWILEDGVHTITQGTSMAAPHVAGLVALMLEGEGYASKTKLLSKLQETARSDGYTGALPNATWGGGKIDALAATIVTTPVWLTSVSVERYSDGVHLEWEVSLDLAATHFRILRSTPNGPEETLGVVGPGPSYSFIDPALLDSAGEVYWLVALDSGQELERLGPFVPVEPEDLGGTGIADLTLDPPRPNPFSVATRSSVTLPGGSVQVEVVDAAGRTVRTLFEGRLGAKTEPLLWNGRTDRGDRAASGLYWIRCRSQGRSEAQRVLYLRGR